MASVSKDKTWKFWNTDSEYFQVLTFLSAVNWQTLSKNFMFQDQITCYGPHPLYNCNLLTVPLNFKCFMHMGALHSNTKTPIFWIYQCFIGFKPFSCSKIWNESGSISVKNWKHRLHLPLFDCTVPWWQECGHCQW